MKVVLGLAALLGLSYMVADKSMIDEYSLDLSRKVRIPCLVIIAVCWFLLLA